MSPLSVFKCCWPEGNTVDFNVLTVAMEILKNNETLRIPWCATRNIDDLSEKVKLARPVPAHFGVQEGLNFFHGTSVYNLFSIRVNGLKTSDKGAGSMDPGLYTSKNRRTPAHIYCVDDDYILLHDYEGQPLYKKVKCLLGVGSLLAPGYHPQKVTRNKAYKHQFIFKPGTYQLLWVEIVATEDCVIDWTGRKTDRENRRYSARRDQAAAMITVVQDADVMSLGPAPAARVRKRPRLADRDNEV